MKQMASGKEISKSKGSSTSRWNSRLTVFSPQVRFVVCVKSGGYVDLEPRKVYAVTHDPAARAAQMLRVQDGSGEDYLYPASFFRPIQASPGLFRLIEDES
jgi:hypothetical protein